MKVHVSEGVDGGQQGCTGHGRCAVLAGELFDVDDDGYSTFRGRTVDVPVVLEDAARHGVAVCPERAIVVHE